MTVFRTPTLVAALALAFAGTVPAHAQAPATPASPAPLKNDEASYIIGLDIAGQMKQSGMAPDLSEAGIARGLKDGFAGKTVSKEDQQRLGQWAQTQREAHAARNEAAASAFLAKNGKEPGVVTTASGLQYRIVEAGNASEASPKADDRVSVNYRGKLLDGTEFDSSYSRGQPATFGVGQVIPGWTEALQMMKPGSKWQLFIPPALAYGKTDRPGIPGNSLLIFDVELLSVVAKAP